MENKFKAGDKVVVFQEPDGSDWWVDAMNGWIDKEVTIKDVYYEPDNRGVTQYFVVEDDHVYCEDSLRLVGEKAIMPEQPPKKKRVKKAKLKALINVLKSKMGKWKGTVDRASYALRFSEAPDCINAHDVCHARLRWPYDHAKKGECTEIVLEVKQTSEGFLNRDKIDVKQFNPYLRYILNDSPWAVCFLTKNIGTAKIYGVKMDVDKTLSQLVGAAIALREGWEFSYKLELFNNLLARGYSGDVAYLACSFGKIEKGIYTMYGGDGGHTAMNNGMDWDEVKKFFIEGHHHKQNEKPFRKSYQQQYGVFDAIAKQGGNNTISSVFLEKAGGKVEGKGWSKVMVIPKGGEIILADWLTNELKKD